MGLSSTALSVRVVRDFLYCWHYFDCAPFSPVWHVDGHVDLDAVREAVKPQMDSLGLKYVDSGYDSLLGSYFMKYTL